MEQRLRELETRCKEYPDSPLAWIDLVRHLRRMGRITEALEQWTRFLTHIGLAILDVRLVTIKIHSPHTSSCTRISFNPQEEGVNVKQSTDGEVLVDIINPRSVTVSLVSE